MILKLLTLCGLAGCLPGIAQSRTTASPPTLENVPIVSIAADLPTDPARLLDLKITKVEERLFWNKKALKLGWAAVNDLRGGQPFTLAIWAEPDTPMSKIQSAIKRGRARQVSSIHLAVKTDPKIPGFKILPLDVPEKENDVDREPDPMLIHLHSDGNIELILESGENQLMQPSDLLSRAELYHSASRLAGLESRLELRPPEKVTYETVCCLLAPIHSCFDAIFIIEPPKESPSPPKRVLIPRRPVPPARR